MGSFNQPGASSPTSITVNFPAAGIYPYEVDYASGGAPLFLDMTTRPKGVSPSARYVSLLEDATWFDCSIDLDKDVNICKAWTWTGRLIVDGEFRLEDEGRAATKLELRHSLVQVTNGRASMIYLFGERGAFTKILVPISK